MARLIWFPALLAVIAAGCGASTAGEPSGRTQTTAAPTPSPVPAGAEVEVTVEPESFSPPFSTASWQTDFRRHTVPLEEIISGGPPKDGIPAIDNPKYVSVDEAGQFLDPNEPVIAVTLNGDTRAFPIRILIWHEIANAEVGGIPVSVTYCPLCNSALTFDRRFEDLVLDFGTTGRLRYSDLVMYDRQTETWWQQLSGEGIVGELAGESLVILPASLVSWEEFRQAHPEAEVLSQETGHSRPYGRNPYSGYDSASFPFLYRGPEVPDALQPMERVVTVSLDGEKVAYPYQALEKEQVINDQVGQRPLVVFWKPGQASALDASSIAGGKDVGSGVVFDRRVEGRVLTFQVADQGLLRDEDTGSQWNLFGRAVSGPLEGSQLEPIVHTNSFWFAWAAHAADGRVYQGT